MFSPTDSEGRSNNSVFKDLFIIKKIFQNIEQKYFIYTDEKLLRKKN